MYSIIDVTAIVAGILSCVDWGTRMNLEKLSDIPAKPLGWVWNGVIPEGQVTLVTGEPGVGKSLFAMDAIARLTRGERGLSIADQGEPGQVILFSGEDGITSVVRNRLEAAKAALPLVNVVVNDTNATSAKPELRRSRLDHDGQMESLELYLTLLRESGEPCRLIVIDSVKSLLDATNSRDEAKIRATMAKLTDLADRTGVAILLIATPSKVEKGKRGNWTPTSPVVAEVARSVWTIVRDPDEPGRRLLLPVKTNLCETPPGVGFAIQNQRICWENEWVRQTAEQYVADTTETERLHHVAAKSELSRVTDWVKKRLNDAPVYTSVLKADAAGHDISEKTLMRALILSGCRKGKEKKSDGRWFWRLPDPLTGPVVSGSPVLQTRTLELKSLAEIYAEADQARALANTTKKGT